LSKQHESSRKAGAVRFAIRIARWSNEPRWIVLSEMKHHVVQTPDTPTQAHDRKCFSDRWQVLQVALSHHDVSSTKPQNF